MESRYQIYRASPHGASLIALSGVLDETFDRKQLSGHNQSVLVIDLEGVRRVTSFGVREWMGALKDLKATYYAFVNCHPSVVSQFNMVAGFAGIGEVVSLYAPYLCPECETECERLVDLRHEYQLVASGSPPAMRCPNCSAEAEFDDIPESYFSYVASRPPPVVPGAAQRLIDGESSQDSAVLRVQKEVEGEVTAIRLFGPLDERARFKRLVDGLEGQVVVIGADITGVTDDGLQHFSVLTHAEGATVHLARIPAFLLSAITAHPGTSDVSVVSTMLPLRCAACGSVTTVDATAEVLHAAPPQVEKCSTCSAEIPVAETSSDLFIAAQTAVTANLPEPVSKYLASSQKKSEEVLSVRLSRMPAPPNSDGETPELWRTYRVSRRLGAGGMAEVFLATQLGPEGFEKTVVLKKLLPNLVSEPTFTHMFLEEARLAARVSHPNVVQILDLGKVDNEYCIAMEYVQGHNLREILEAAKQANEWVPVELACFIVANICAGLHAAHSCKDGSGEPLGIVHRDVSPANILVSIDGAVKVADFGIARALRSVGHTKPGELKGKLRYLSPEQVIAPGTPPDARSDIFAAGIILFECLTGRHLFRRPTEYETLSAIVSDPIPSARSFRPEVPARLDAIVAKALAREYSLRYQTATQFQEELESFVHELRRPAAPAQLSKWVEELMARGVEVKGAGTGSHSRNQERPPERPKVPSLGPNTATDPANAFRARPLSGLNEARQHLGEAGRRLDRILEQRRGKPSS